MGICLGRSSSATHPFSPNESTGNHQLHVIRKRLNPESTKSPSLLPTSRHTKPIVNVDHHAGGGAAYRITVRIPEKQQSGILSPGNVSKEEALATFVAQKHGDRQCVKSKGRFNSWRPPLETISEEEALTNDQNN